MNYLVSEVILSLFKLNFSSLIEFVVLKLDFHFIDEMDIDLDV